MVTGYLVAMVQRILGALMCLWAAGCASEQIRGKDASVPLPAVRARHLGRPSELTERLRFAIGVEAGATTARGDFTRSDGVVDYAADVAQAHGVIGAVSQRLEILGLFGLGYGDIDVAAPTGQEGHSGAGISGGAELGWRTWSWLGPYGRFTGMAGDGGAWRWRRLEVGVDVRPVTWWSLQAAFADQAMEDDDFAGADFRVETRGVHLGMMFRF